MKKNNREKINMPKATKTKDELLVENAILRSHEHVRIMLKEELIPFTKTIKELDSRVQLVEVDVRELKDTVGPLTAFKRRVWWIIIFGALGLGIAGNAIADMINQYFK